MLASGEMGWFIALSLVFIVSVLFLLLRKPGEGSLLVHALLIPVASSFLLIVAIVALIWGVGVEARDTVRFAGRQVSAEALRTTSRALGVGIITGIVAGALIAATQRWHDFEKNVNWAEYVKKRAQKEGFEIVEADGGFYITDAETKRKLGEKD